MSNERKIKSECEKTLIIRKINEIINADDNVNIMMIDCGHELLRWSATPNICRKRHNVIVSSVEGAEVVNKASCVTVISSGIPQSDFVKKITELCLRRHSLALKSGSLIVLKDDDVSFYVELMTLKGNLGKYRSNKKKRLMTRLGLLNDYELTLFFNLIFSLPYFVLRVFFLKKNTTGGEDEKVKMFISDKMRCKSLNIWSSINSLLLCTHDR